MDSEAQNSDQTRDDVEGHGRYAVSDDAVQQADEAATDEDVEGHMKSRKMTEETS